MVNRPGKRWKRTALTNPLARIGKHAGIARFRVSAQNYVTPPTWRPGVAASIP